MKHSPQPRQDPLTDVLLRPTAVAASVGDAPLRRAASQRSGVVGAASVGEPVPAKPADGCRGGAAMARSRSAILQGARRTIELSGTKITMANVAAASGVAKATLYNHFRTREDLLGAVLIDEVDRLVAAIGPLDLVSALAYAATAVSEHPLLEALGNDPAILAELARVDVGSVGWAHVAEATDKVLNRAGRGGTPTVLRWLSSFVIAPGDERDIASDVAVLETGLPASWIIPDRGPECGQSSAAVPPVGQT